MTQAPTGYDALLLVSFGGPEGPDDVMPFLENVTGGRGIPRERLLEVAGHYHRFGGVSPINGQCRELKAAIEADFAANGLDLPVYWGNRNWHPLLPDTLETMAADGVRRALAFVTSAYASYSACRVYQEDLERARAEVGESAPAVDKIRHFYDHPGFVGPMVRATRDALLRLPEDERADARLVFVAHSIPTSMAEASGPDGGAYEAQVTEAARLVAEGVGDHPWDVAWCSRSGPPSQPWLEPDVCDHLTALHEKGVRSVAIVPVGFVSDHMEVIFDLDTEALAHAAGLGMHAVRVPAVGVAPEFVAMVRELVLERTRPAATPRRALGRLGPAWDVCPAGCCLSRSG
ncbi:MAG: ferrochelatase [Streptosporangiales bacterium]|nr:ferrochelatase [Streptosporangiales bacterium]MBO0890573.1 ferrochelatase [Acidothermales bacterium]